MGIVEDEEKKKDALIAATMMADQQQSYISSPFIYGNNCPSCLRPYHEKPQIKRDLLTDEEKELLLKLKKLVTEKRQFLDNLREIIGVQF